MITKQNINDAPIYFNNLILGELYDKGINCWIAGGSIRDYFMGVEAADYDIFFPNQQEFDKAKSFFLSNLATKVWESDNGLKLLYNGKTFDLVKIYHPTPESTISRFDFTTAMFCVHGDELYAGDTSFDDLENKKLIINIVTYPDSTLKRAFKYYTKGFRMSAKESEKLVDIIKTMPTSKSSDYVNFVSGETVPPPVIITPTPSPKPPIQLPKKNYIPYIILGSGLLLLLLSRNK